MKLASVDVWGVAIAAVSGGVLGIPAVTAYHLLHDHSRLPSSALLPHFWSQLITACVGGALVIGYAALAYDRKRKLKDRPHASGSQRVHRGQARQF